MDERTDSTLMPVSDISNIFDKYCEAPVSFDVHKDWKKGGNRWLAVARRLREAAGPMSKMSPAR